MNGNGRYNRPKLKKKGLGPLKAELPSLNDSRKITSVKIWRSILRTFEMIILEEFTIESRKSVQFSLS